MAIYLTRIYQTLILNNIKTMWVTLFIVATSLGLGRTTAPSYCSTNTYPVKSSGMQLTKEPVPYEFGFEDKFKSIHCCAKGYRSIEWFKDNVAYPWSAGVSNLIQYPEAANQTLYTQRASRSDSGNYTCRISNETHTQQHTIYLEILEKPPDAPKTMFISKDQWVEEGSPARLYCEALVGRSYLADARSDLRWIKLWSNNSEGELLPSQREIKTIRDDVVDIIGSYLVFDRVFAPDYGTYVCIVRSNEVISKSYVTVHYNNVLFAPTPEHHSIPWRALCLGGACAVLLLVSLIVLHRRCTPRLLLAARIAHARANATTQRARVLEKEFDVLVCFTAVDAELVRGVLLPTLSLKYHYRVHAVQLDTLPDTWYNRLSIDISRCRSLVAVVSPAQHTQPQLMTALRQLRALPLPPVVVLLQDLPKLKRESKDSRGECLVTALRRTRLLPWRHLHERAFWTALRLALPLPPQLPTNDKEIKVQIDESKDSRFSSMTALV